MKVVGWGKWESGKARVSRECRHRVALTVGDRREGLVVCSFTGTCQYLVYLYGSMQRRLGHWLPGLQYYVQATLRG
jgi:hypothetical protein